MTVTTSAPASDFTRRYGNPSIDCGGAQIRAQCRHLAMVVTIHGDIDATNVNRVSEHTRHFILPTNSLVLDLSGVDSFAAEGISLLYRIDEACRAAGMEWTLVASHAVIERLQDSGEGASFPMTRSVHRALRDLADVIVRRRQLLLPLIGKTA
jgi:anti-anti-sigma factor